MAKQDTPLDVVIIGAGLAGLLAARVLREKHNVTVYERSSSPVEVGAAINVGPNGVRILDTLGFDRSKAGSLPVAATKVFTKEGHLQMDERNNYVEKYGADWLFQHRADLRGEFLRLATEETGISGIPGTPARVLWDQKVIDISPEEGRITLASGEKVKADLVVAADGIKSMVRPYVVGDAAFQTARPSGLSAFRFTLELDDIKAALKELPEILQPDQPTCLSMVYSFDNTMRSVVMYPCRNHELLNFVCIVPDGSLKEKTTESWTASGDKEELMSLFSDFPPWVHDYFRIAKNIKLWQLRDQDPLPTYIRGRTVLIGDAAHAMTPHQGQGGTQAVEDAEGLRLFLQQGVTSEHVPGLLKDFDSVRRPRASLIQNNTRKAKNKRTAEEHSIMGYSEVLCHICGVSFNINRSRTDKEPRSAAWGHIEGNPENSHGRWGCYYVQRNGSQDEPGTASSEPVKYFPPNIEPEDSSDDGWTSDTPDGDWEHIAGPDCKNSGSYNGNRISTEAMKGCQTFQCIVPKGDNWQPERDDEDFEASGNFFLSGLGDDLPSRDMDWPVVSPRRHSKDYVRAENTIWDFDDVSGYCMPFHPTCFEIYKRASSHRYGTVDIECLMKWWYLESGYDDFFLFPRHPAVKRGQEQWWRHERGSEFLVANPCFIPGLDALFQSAQSVKGSNEDRSGRSRTVIGTGSAPTDPFSKLPGEMIREILINLNFKDLANLRLTSRVFLHLPNSVLYELTIRNTPWLYEAWSSLPISFWATTTQEEIDQEIERRGSINTRPHPVKLLNKTETDWLRLNMEVSRNWKELLGLQNRRRIWNDCQEILNRVDEYRKQGKI
ncbi:salicylate hydroxylase [Fusarium beomiforme]|uniref:Salicylate hydroxylase n=1 Tax=Fusarium beomiforme TaxID=44412 RepID=A0A9P5DUU8_9HYPO|nr:salicylate hydroxylase [Fusarium beomiforme]